MILIVINPRSGKNNSGKLESILDRRMIKDDQYDTLYTKNEHTIDMFFSKNEKEYSEIIVSGGDGTISQVVNAIYKYNVNAKLVIDPSGTTNEFSLTLNESTENKAIHTDIGVYNKLVFLYSLSFGNFTNVTYKTPQQLKNIFGRAAYWIYGFVKLNFLNINKYDFDAYLDDEHISGSFAFGAISNAKSVGTIIDYGDEFILNDGKFEVILIRFPKNISELFAIAQALFLRTYNNNLFVVRKVKRAQFKSKYGYSWNQDGEFAGRLKEVNVSVLENALTVEILPNTP